MKLETDGITKLTSNNGTHRAIARRLPKHADEVKLRKILVPIDFSESSRKAVQYALAFARKFKADILLLHVVEDVAPPPDILIGSGGLPTFNMHEEATKQLYEWRRKTASRSVNMAVRTGNPRHEIVQAATESSIDLIILGTHGRTGLAHLLLGGTAEQVVRHAPCPVMVVRVVERDFVGPPRTT